MSCARASACRLRVNAGRLLGTARARARRVRDASRGLQRCLNASNLRRKILCAGAGTAAARIGLQKRALEERGADRSAQKSAALYRSLGKIATPNSSRDGQRSITTYNGAIITGFWRTYCLIGGEGWNAFGRGAALSAKERAGAAQEAAAGLVKTFTLVDIWDWGNSRG